MARIITTIVIAGAAVLFFAQNASAFRCEGGIISRGDFIDIVIAKCGEPTTSRVVKEELTGSFGTTATNEGLGPSLPCIRIAHEVRGVKHSLSTNCRLSAHQ